MKREETIRVEAVLAEATVVGERLLFIVRSLAGDIAIRKRFGAAAVRTAVTLPGACNVVGDAF